MSVALDTELANNGYIYPKINVLLKIIHFMEKPSYPIKISDDCLKFEFESGETQKIRLNPENRLKNLIGTSFRAYKV
jgi:hypothetical protein